MCAADPDRPPICSPANTWAFMSFSAEDEVRDMTMTRNIAIVSRWYARDRDHTGVLIANNWADLLDGSIAQPLVDGGVDGDQFWTFSTWDGSLTPYNCVGGTYGGGPAGTMGTRGTKIWQWINIGAPWCMGHVPLFCICY
jgi:hypothetical protein